ncbi:MAG: hypothetical protein R3D25_15570 [Geminicoccaceae bacterium]
MAPPDSDDDEPMEVDDVECEGFDFVKVYLDGRRECFDGVPEDAGFTNYRTEGRIVYQTQGMGQPTRGNS